MPAPVLLILASRSPRRCQLLEAAGYRFEVVLPSTDEEDAARVGEPVGDYVMRLAREKARDVASQLFVASSARDATPRLSASAADRSRRVILACDTVAQCAGELLGKPTDETDARRMLTLLAGRRHQVYSGVCLWPEDRPQPQTALAATTLEMEPLDRQAIEDYLATGLWQGKSGAFGYQDRLDWLKIVEGSESNVVGLPLELLEEMLSSLGDE